MPYSKKDFKESNVNYLNKDFGSLKASLINYAKSYFPNSYKDFNDSSTGMMLMEMSAYVGDVLSFYVDQQYREMLLPLAEERRNIINLAKMLGYRTKPSSPAFTTITFTSTLPAMSDDSSKVDYTQGGSWDSGFIVNSNGDSNITFQTLEPVDFSITGSTDNEENDTSDPTAQDVSGLNTHYKLKRKVRAMSSITKTMSFPVSQPKKFLRLKLPEKNVIDIISVVDSNGNNWYEVDYLAQDKIPIETHYSSDPSRMVGTSTSAYYKVGQEAGTEIEELPIPYSLAYIHTNKRFIIETNDDNSTSLVFGNGILKQGSSIGEEFLNLEQAGIVIPGQTSDLPSSIDPTAGNSYDSLGEAPNQTSLTVKYRVGGGISSNVPSGDLTRAGSSNSINGVGTIDTITNELPAFGGKGSDTIEEIREKAKSFFTTQNRCVTKSDYEARILNMNRKFGYIAKVYVTRTDVGTGQALLDTSAGASQITAATNALQAFGSGDSGWISDVIANNPEGVAASTILTAMNNQLQPILTQLNTGISLLPEQALDPNPLGSIKVFILSYDNTKSLVGNPLAAQNNLSDGIPDLLKNNIKNYLDNYKILTDTIEISDGYIVNFGVSFEVVAHKHSNRQEVKIACIERIKQYFNVDFMQFVQPIYLGKLEYELMSVEGVRSVNDVTLTQDLGDGAGLLFKYSMDGDILNINGNAQDGINGYKYNFSPQNEEGEGGANVNGTILPANPNNPAIFELKNPNQNIRGVVL